MVEEETLVGTATGQPAYVDETKIILPKGYVTPESYPPIVISAILEKEAPELLPEKIKLPSLPKLKPVIEKVLLLDIETTGIQPYDSRVICISTKDMTKPDEPIRTFFDLDEKKLIDDFFSYIDEVKPTIIAGWGIGFDYKHLFYKLCYYRIKSASWFETTPYDLMDLFRKGTEKYIYTLQKPDPLDNVAKYLLGEKKTMSMKELLIAWREKQYDKIIEYNRKDVEMIQKLWLLTQYVQEKIEKIEEE